uniref:PRC-barrel domain-containing protein n=1 Tax=Geoglobus ahangari TaxID=113653 RepID=A0A7C4W531_9EURY
MDLICKFVEKNGKKIGESIDVYDGYLIVKKSDVFFGIPTDSIKEVKDEVIIVSEFDEEKGAEIGRRWVEMKSKPVSVEELKKYGFGEK